MNTSSAIMLLVLISTFSVMPACAADSDNTPPDILGFDFDPKIINTTASSASIKFTAHLTDDLSGTDSMQVYFSSPSDSQNIFFSFSTQDRVSGTDLDGIYERSVTLPRYSEQGTWKLRYVSPYDRVRNSKDLNRADMMNLGFPVEFEVVSREDISPPEILGFDFSPKAINTTTSSADIKFTARLADDLSGTDSMQVYFSSPSDSQNIFFSFSTQDRVSGTVLDGIYERSITLPRYSEQGTWKLRYVSPYDRVRNNKDLNRADMTNLGFPVEFEVVSREDISPPEILGFDFSPKALDTVASSGNIKFTARLVDDLSGTDSMQVYFNSPSDSQNIFFSFSTQDRVSGTDLDGIYERSITLPRYCEQGTWKLRYVSPYDRVGNRRSLNGADMMNLGFPVEFEIVSKEDTTPPDILGFDFDPRSLNTTASSGNITFTAHLADDQSGLESAHALFFSPSRSESLSISFYPKDRVSGTDLDGIYESSDALPKYSEQGTWSLEYAWLTDRAGNTRELNRADVIAIGFPVEIQVSSKAVHELYYPDFTDTVNPDSWRSWLVVQNPSPSVANITLSIWSRSGELLFDDAISVMPRGVSAIRPRNLVGSDCSGSAVLTSEQPIMGTCQITRNSNEMCMSYNALDQGSRVLYYPDYTDTADPESWRSWLVLQNPNAYPADIDLEVRSRAGDLLYSGSQSIPAYGVGAIRPRSLVGYDCTGSVTVTSDLPIMGTCQITRNNNLMCMSYTAIAEKY